MQGLAPDFWWLPQKVDAAGLRVGVGHHSPLRDKDQPSLGTWQRSLGTNGVPQNEEKLYHLEFVDEWRQRWGRSNVYRTLMLFGASAQPQFLGPFLLDIDNEGENLADALKIARVTVFILLREASYNVRPEDLRIFFSGRKGFNIEVRPQALKIDLTWQIDAQIRYSAKIQDHLIQRLRSIKQVRDSTRNVVNSRKTLIDRVYKDDIGHPYIRLHDSLNEWIGSSGARMVRRRVELSLADLESKDARVISAEAETGTRP